MHAPEPLGLYTFAVGDLKIAVIRDAMRPMDPAILGLNAPEGAIAQLMQERNLPSPVINTFNVMLIQAGDKMILMDTGRGAGSLLPTLEILHLVPDRITDVVISHLHGDHIGTVLTDGVLTFPKAMIHYPETERDGLEHLPDGGGVTANRAILKIAAEAGQLTLFKADNDVLPGILHAIAAYGHTPGHTAFMLSSGGESLLCPVDAAAHHVVSLAHPEWQLQFDWDKLQAVETRQRLFGEAADQKLRIMAYHFPFPGVGFVSRQGNGFHFTPAM